MGTRRRISGLVSEGAYDGWVALSDALGASVTGIMEAVGNRVPQFLADGEQTVTFDDLAAEAQAVDRERRKRRQ